ncbi:uncharacterized protein LOC121467575 [Drosophila elegans]|uniref:uncharacterized protein LOC121467575 n=1 Tax=Drosophila elegans TaxID=30023 RepID=UPI001BC84CDE|nr:uncharacterized protein LOC121467575 [Drosophila elegans]
MTGKVTKTKSLKARVNEILTDAMLKNEVSQRNRYARARYRLMQMDRKNLAKDQAQKEVINLDTSKPSDLAGKSKFHAVLAFQKPCDLAKLDSEFSIHPKSHHNCWERPKPATLTSKEACDQENPLSQVVAGDQAQKEVTPKLSDLAGKSKFHAILALQKPRDQAKLDSEFSIHLKSHHNCWERPKRTLLTSKEACGQEKSISQSESSDHFPSCVTSHASSSSSSSSSHVKSQEDNKNKGICHLSQIKLLAGAGPEKQDAQVATPKTELCTRVIQLIPDSKEDYMNQWLISAAGLPPNHSPKEPVQQEAIELPCGHHQ